MTIFVILLKCSFSHDSILVSNLAFFNSYYAHYSWFYFVLVFGLFWDYFRTLLRLQGQSSCVWGFGMHFEISLKVRPSSEPFLIPRMCKWAELNNHSTIGHDGSVNEHDFLYFAMTVTIGKWHGNSGEFPSIRLNGLKDLFE